MVRGELNSIRLILSWQASVVLLATFLFAAMKDWEYGRWAFIGGMIAFIPNLYFALRIKSSQGKEPQKILRAFYVGESGKLILTAGLFAIVFQYPAVKLVPVMITFVAVLMVFWVALLRRSP